MEATAEEVQVAKYPAYRDSGVEWLGEIPAHWECIRMKHLFRDVSLKNKPDAELLSVTQNQGVVPRTWVENRMVMPSGNLESFKFIQKGDFAISLRSFEGGLEYCHHDGIISPAYTVLRAQRNFDSQYYKYLFKSFSFISELQTSVVGIREGKNISYPELSYSFLPIPSKEEQTVIAQFLDRKTTQIDKAISIKERQIELLKERRQVLIHNAVTHGLNSAAPMKESGVEWIGEIPAHWEVKSLKHFCFITKLTGFEYSNHWRITEDGDVIALRGFNIAEGRLSLNETECITTELSHFLNRSKLHKGDIVYPCTGTIGNAALIEEDDRYHINQNIAKISPDLNLVDPYFLLSVLLSHPIKAQIHFNNTSQMQPVILIGGLRNIKVPFPPKEEQLEIENCIQRFSEKANRSIFLKEKEIEKLKEYKASLINSAVTGKIKVC